MASRKKNTPHGTHDSQGQDHEPAYDVVAASMTAAVEGKTPRELLAAACVRSLVQMNFAGCHLWELEGAVIIKTLAQRLKGRAWIEREVQRLTAERAQGEQREDEKPKAQQKQANSRLSTRTKRAPPTKRVAMDTRK